MASRHGVSVFEEDSEVVKESVAGGSVMVPTFPIIGLTGPHATHAVPHGVPRDQPYASELRSRLQGATGHPQGIVSAVCIAASVSPQSLVQNSTKALKWLFFSGLRGQ
jgi:hypothetical protein